MSDLQNIFETVHSKAYKAVLDKQQARNIEMKEVAETLRLGLEKLVQEIESETDFLVTNGKGLQRIGASDLNSEFFGYEVELNFSNKLNNKPVGSAVILLDLTNPKFVFYNNRMAFIYEAGHRRVLAEALVTGVAKQVAANERVPKIKVPVLGA